MPRLPGLLLCALVCLPGQPSTALADRPATYKGRLDFAVTGVQVISATEVHVTGSIEGLETRLGKIIGVVEYVYDPNTGAFSGSLTKRAANGDELHETLTGQFTATGSVGEITIIGGTGRFLGATGSADFVGVWTAADFSTARTTFEGTLSRAR